jgi:hypothetical protein
MAKQSGSDGKAAAAHLKDAQAGGKLTVIPVPKGKENQPVFGHAKKAR